ncbi:hypothetical protein ACH4TC_27735 [Streptomyces spororaveus]|uniref:hypothetical protein n=1 Tax=Streptomyces spororaveus TaxID=284039 RepID=UPI00378AFDD8
MTWQAAGRNRAQWPEGVEVRAVMALAPADNVMTEDVGAYEMTKAPVAVVRGTCDGRVGREALAFAAEATAKSSAGFRQLEMPGANRNYFNTQWSPRSGQVAALDHATHDATRDAAHPGRCTDPGGSPYAPQLTEAAQRRVGAAFLVAFLRCHLTDGGSR